MWDKVAIWSQGRDLIEFFCMYNKKKEKKNSISNWSRKQDNVPIDIQPIIII